ncbi:MAG TPA: SemiSWEET transporter [Thermoanaerobaculia bacterium]|nr:SemiSWEET transporter [Thermoanaerobaculia bacterium]
MKNNLANLVAILAAILVTGSWLPQVVKTWKTRRAQDFSWAWLAAFSVGVALWGVYGVLRDDLALILTNVLTLFLVLSIVVVKMREER